ncbi:M20/M25/M40 family metallo-hydrolase [Microvirga pudoricolor]|uniref:M20/M25/M40 family metallo-hydrolase n=1 Tax=Microvirga pudoricolor TaxID=2778729 RepID=UPI00195005D2|nr:M20/M25/M40 family metallo-hydrolase [Microvirga pudoricolor]MBM6595544.1 M20/M25/M40 family metallo-hydrolase [Microvirga pudoricolor]
MDFANLPFDIDSMLHGLRRWVECESPSYDPHRVNEMMTLAAHDFAEAGGRVERIPGSGGFGDCIRVRFGDDGNSRPGILVLGHLDTVHPVSTLEKLSWRREDNRCYGPGIFDMKAGNYIALEAMRQLKAAGQLPSLPVTFLLTSDEEVGSASTRDLIEKEAAVHRYVLIPEPGRPDGGVVTGRYAIARFELEAIGRPSHAGARLSEGRSAIRILADAIPVIEGMTDTDCTFSVGVIHGGQWVNCVASTCTGEALSMAKRQEDLDRGVARMLALNSGDEVSGRLIVKRSLTRPVWEANRRSMELYEMTRQLAKELGVDLNHESVGGGSDGNFTGQLEHVATLDGLGVQGAGAHTLNEHIFVDSLVTRGRLFAGLLATLS